MTALKASVMTVSTQTFGPNWVRVFTLLVAAILGYAFAKDLDPSRATIPLSAVNAVRVALVAVPVALSCWLLSARLTVDHVGLRYRSLLGQKEMRWDEVDELYAGAITTLLYGVIPLGTRYSFKLKAGVNTEQHFEKVRYVGGVKFTRSSVKDGTAARVMSFGSRFSRAEKISTLLAEFTFPHVWRKVSQRYNEGFDVRFGDFVFNRQGVKADFLGMFPDLTRLIAWKDVCSYRVEQGSFVLVYKASTSAVKMYTEKRQVAQIANFRIMMALLNQISPMSVASSASN
jgi:hypothetical protein